jgi:type IV fimbrial biogenesis protein FimT
MQAVARHAARLALGIQRGVTAVEACVVVAIVAILVGGAVPSFDSMRRKQVLDGSSHMVTTTIALARSTAVTRNEAVRVSVLAAQDGGSCMIVHSGAVADCACSAGAKAQCTGAAQLIKALEIPVKQQNSLAANVASMRFDPINGTVTPAGTIRPATPDGRAVHHVVSILGRVRTCSPGAAVAGHKAC